MLSARRTVSLAAPVRFRVMQAFLDKLTTPDLIVLGVCLLFAIRGAWKGFAWQAVRTVGLLLALFGATQWFSPVGDWLEGKFSFIPDIAAPVIAWVALLVAIFLVISYLAHLARGAMRSADLRGVDRVLGLAMGAVMGLVFCTIGFVVWGSVQEPDELKAELSASFSVRYMAETMRVVKPLFPEPIRERWGGVLDTLNEVSPPQPKSAPTPK